MSIGNTVLTNYPGSYCDDDGNTCSGTVLDGDTNTVRYTVTITWDGMIVSNGSISHSITGNQVYQCRIVDHPHHNENRIRNITIKGNVNKY